MNEPTADAAHPTVAVGKTNLRGAAIPHPPEAPEGLAHVYRALVWKAEEALTWYEAAQQLKRRGARATRGSAIFLGALATIAPSLLGVLPERVGELSLRQLTPLATVLGVLAGTMLLLDKFYGFSSGWMRYATTYQDLQAKVERFKLEWRRQLYLLRGATPPSHEQVMALFDFFSAFLAAVNDAVRTETQAWVQEFRGTLAELDQSVDAQRSAAAAASPPDARGALRVVVANVGSFDQGAWSLQLDNRQEEPKVGQSTAVVPSLAPGLYKVRVAAVRDGRPVATEHSVAVKAGEISELAVETLG